MSENFSMEQGLAELQEINNKLNDPGIPIEEAINLYEKGKKIALDCQKSLEQAKKKLIEINPNLE